MENFWEELLPERRKLIFALFDSDIRVARNANRDHGVDDVGGDPVSLCGPDPPVHDLADGRRHPQHKVDRQSDNNELFNEREKLDCHLSTCYRLLKVLRTEFMFVQWVDSSSDTFR